MSELVGGPPGTDRDPIRVHDAIADPAERHVRDRGLELLNAYPGERLLEIGVGTGRALVRLASAVKHGGMACGLDISARMLHLSRERPATGPRPVRLQQGDGRSLPYPAATFDGVFVSFTLELFVAPDIDRVLQEIKRVLRPEGRLVIVCLTEVRQARLVAMAYAWLQRHVPHLLGCRPIDVLRFLDRNGYRSLVTDSLRAWFLPVTVLLAKPLGSATFERTPRRDLQA